MKAGGWKMMSKGEEQVVAEVGAGNHMGSLFFRRLLLKLSRKHDEKIDVLAPLLIALRSQTEIRAHWVCRAGQGSSQKNQSPNSL